MGRRDRGEAKNHASLPAALLFVLILAGTVYSSGCLESYPSVVPEQVQTPTVPEQGEIGPIVLTPSATQVPSVVAPAGSQTGYISRSFGFVPYATSSEYKITQIDSSAKKDSTGRVYIQGRIKNEGPGSISYLHVTYRLNDANGNVIGNVEASIEYFPPGKIWRYTTTSFPADTYQSYELANVIVQ